MIVAQEKDLTGRKLTEKQIAVLREVVATNGGGVSGYDYPKSVWQALINRGLVQGKLNGDGKVVHTRDGWNLIKGEKK